MSLYSVLKSSWKAIMPQRLRDAIFSASADAVKRARRSFIAKLEKGADHNEIYDTGYYSGLDDPTMQVSAAMIADSIIAAFSPRSVADIGCGTGVLMQALQPRGVSCQGFEYSQAASATSA